MSTDVSDNHTVQLDMLLLCIALHPQARCLILN